ncbi:hypothetical protein [Methanobacterium spitsbergense]|nr:hypothetical protein [Methanobacterium spitsbergense]
MKDFLRKIYGDSPKIIGFIVLIGLLIIIILLIIDIILPLILTYF